jgi:hypothetical protein
MLNRIKRFINGPSKYLLNITLKDLQAVSKKKLIKFGATHLNLRGVKPTSSKAEIISLILEDINQQLTLSGRITRKLDHIGEDIGNLPTELMRVLSELRAGLTDCLKDYLKGKANSRCATTLLCLNLLLVLVLAWYALAS